MSSPTNLRIDLAPSHRLAVLLGVAHCLAIVATWLSLSGWSLRFSLLGIVISGVACLAGALHLLSSSAVRLQLDARGRAAWRDRRGEWHEAQLGSDRFVSTQFVAVCLFRPMLRRKWVVILPDSTSSDQFRQLRVWLRWHGKPSPEAEESTLPQ
jgi:hypothetical protein